jgi:hypothetical protein
VLYPPLKWPGCQDDHWPDSSAEGKNARSYTSITTCAFRLHIRTILPDIYVSKFSMELIFSVLLLVIYRINKVLPHIVTTNSRDQSTSYEAIGSILLK